MSSTSLPDAAFPHDARFAPTRWSLVCAAGADDPASAQSALEQLCRAYWYPLYAFVRRSGKSPEEAEDLTQEFFARVLASDFLAQADRERGRFRTFLLTALQRFLTNEWHRATAQKRGAGIAVISIDAALAEDRYHAEPVDIATPELLYERRWAITLLDQVLTGLADEYAANGQAAVFAALRDLLGGSSAVDPAYAEIATRLGMTEAAVKVAMYRLRRRYADRLRAEIAQTVASPADIEDEIARLFQLFQR